MLRRSLTSRITVALVAALCALPMMGTPSAHAGDNDAGDNDIVEISWTESDITITDLLALTREKLGLQFVWQSRDKNLHNRTVAGNPVFRGTPSDVFGRVRSLLLTFDLICRPIGAAKFKTYRVIDARQSGSLIAMQPEPVTITAENAASYEADSWRFVTTTFHLNHITDLRHVRTALSKLVTGSSIGQITEIPEARALMITDFAPKVVAAYRMISRMDVPPAAPPSGHDMAVVKLEHARVQQVAVLLSNLFAQRRIGPNTPPQPRIVSDERSNQLVVSGETGQVRQIKEMIAQLDVQIAKRAPTPREPVTVEVVRLEHLNALEAAQSLMQLIGSSRALFPTRPSVVGMHTPNAVLLTGTEAARAILNRLVAELDVPTKDKTEDSE